MHEAVRALAVTRRMHAIATTPDGALLTLPELERLAEEELAVAEARARPEPEPDDECRDSDG